MVKGSVCLFKFSGWFSGIDTFQDTQFSEILEGKLQLPDGLGPADILFGLSL
jgi:hypothetical protein